MRLPPLMLLLGLALAAPDTRAADLPPCKGPLEASAPGACGAVDAAGCCDAKGRLYYCDGNDLYCIDCGTTFPACGWSGGGYYDCGASGPLPDPSGLHPIACGGCAAECGPGAACSPACPGLCGSCPSKGASCGDDGQCRTPACDGRECGTDAAGFPCGTCGPDEVCLTGPYTCEPLPAACLPSGSPGCGGCGCEACVCAKYPYCCDVEWDQFCAGACEAECATDCSGCPANPTCAGVACGNYCGVDCGVCAGGAKCIDFRCCTPACDGRTCGDDGCGGSCGTCAGGQVCQAGACVDCEPACDGKACGDDGCGGSCGACGDGKVCIDGACAASLCAGRCGTADGQACGSGCTCYCDEACSGYGDCCPGFCGTCPDMAGCCVPACDGKACGDDGCGGSCGTCPAGSACEGTACVACAETCAGIACGTDACGIDCGTCPDGMLCQAGQCADDPCDGLVEQGCCDGTTLRYCWQGEVHAEDCAGVPLCGWAPDLGYYNCGTTGLPEPSYTFPMYCAGCVPSCSGRACGPDGCGGQCGVCPDGTLCQAGQCADDPCDGLTLEGCCAGSTVRFCAHGMVLARDCADAPACGWNADAGWYDCGTSGEPEPTGAVPMGCPACAPACGDRACGADGCGGSCGSCGDGLACREGACVAPVPDADEPAVEPVPDAPDAGAEAGPDADDAPDARVDVASADVPSTPDAAPPVVEPESCPARGGGCSAGPAPSAPLAGALAAGLACLLALALVRGRRNALLALAFLLVPAASCGTGSGSPADVPAATDPGPGDPAPSADAPDPAPALELPARDAAPEVADSAPLPDPGPADPGEDAPDGPADVAPDLPAPGDVADAADAADVADVAPDPGVPPYDCAHLPAGPFLLEKIPGAVASEDLAFDAEGNLVGSNNQALFRTKAGGKAKLWVPDVNQRAGMRFLPNGQLAVNDDQLGRVLLFEPDGNRRVLVQGLSYPNGMTVDLKGFIYVTEHDANRVLRIDPYTGAYTVLTNKIVNPNGIIFDPTYSRLYIGSFATGWLYVLPVSPDGHPGKVAPWASPIGEGGLLDGIGVDICGNVYVCEYGNTDIWRIPPSGEPAVRIVDGDPNVTYLPNLQWGSGGGWDPLSIYVPDGWEIGVWRIQVGVPTAPRAFP